MRETLEDRQFKQVVLEHSRWLTSQGHQGRRAQLAPFFAYAPQLLAIEIAEMELVDSRLPLADLRYARVIDSQLIGVDLFRCQAYQSCFSRSNLTRARLEGANLTETIARRTVFDQANLVRAVLSRADLLQASLRGAELRDAFLAGANLSQCDFSQADLRGADFTGANLQQADLTGADLRGAILWDAELRGASLRKADLRGTHVAKRQLEDVATLQAARFE
ncbi:MAG: pentapeptide repeat-containing protein [Vulcanimicrobiota bacterium]